MERIPHEQFVPIAQDLPIDKSRRVQHCGSGRDMVVSHTPKGYIAYCFRCKMQGFKFIDTISLPSLQDMKDTQAAEQQLTYIVSLPHDAEPAMPERERLWLMTGGVSSTQQLEYNIQYSHSLRRVLLPVYNNGELVYVQARSCDPKVKPKYLNTQVSKTNILFHSKPSLHNVVVITEDILSAIRVGTTFNAVSPLGTVLSLAQADQLTVYDKVLIWLDNDTAGWDGAVSMRKVLEPIVPCDIISSTHDPKYYDTRSIINIITPYL